MKSKNFFHLKGDFYNLSPVVSDNISENSTKNFIFFQDLTEELLRNFSDEPKLGKISDGFQNVHRNPSKIIPIDKNNPLIYQSGNILRVKSKKSKLVFVRVDDYTNDYVILKKGLKSKKIPYDKFDLKSVFVTFFDFVQKISSSDLHTDVKLEVIRKIFNTLPDDEKKDILIPISSEVLNDDFSYDWPKNLGFIKGTEKPIISLGDNWFRTGYMAGTNFTNKYHSFFEMSIPYASNYMARKCGKFQTRNYISKINAIRNGERGKLNYLLSREKIPMLKKEEFNKIFDEYKKYWQNLTDSELEVNPSYYGIVGIAAPWVSSKTGKKIFSGGAFQYTFPLSGFSMARLGMLYRK